MPRTPPIPTAAATAAGPVPGVARRSRTHASTSAPNPATWKCTAVSATITSDRSSGRQPNRQATNHPAPTARYSNATDGTSTLARSERRAPTQNGPASAATQVGPSQPSARIPDSAPGANSIASTNAPSPTGQPT